jgi:hypothetical protein
VQKLLQKGDTSEKVIDAKQEIPERRWFKLIQEYRENGSGGGI